MTNIKKSILWLLLAGLAAAPVLADQVALDLSTMPGTQCGVEWTEGPCVLWFEAVTADDYQPVWPPQLICFPFLYEGDLILFPARLCVNLDGVDGIESIQVDIHEGAEIGATRVMAYLGDTYVSEVNSTSMAVQTVTLPFTAGTFDTLVISGWETAVTGIRLIGATLVGNETQSLGVVKAMYR